MISGFQFRRKNGRIATYMFKTPQGYYFIVETEAKPLLMLVKEEDLAEFISTSS